MSKQNVQVQSPTLAHFAELLCADLYGSSEYKNNGSEEDDDKLSGKDKDGKITENDDGESELDDDWQLSDIDNSDKDEQCWEQSDLTEVA